MGLSCLLSITNESETMNQMLKLMDKVQFLRRGRVDSESGRVATDHSSSSHGTAVIVTSDGTAIGPGDVEGKFVSQASGRDVELLQKSGFAVVADIGEQFCGPMPAMAGGWAKGKGWY